MMKGILFLLFIISSSTLSLPHPVEGGDDDSTELPDNNSDDISSLLANGTEVSQLLNVFTFFNIENEPFDYEHAQMSCTEPPTPTTKNGIRNENARWYNAGNGKYLVPVIVDSSYTDQERNLLYAAMIEIQETTCITFSIYNSASDLRGYDYVQITKQNSGCFSEGLGRMRKGRQQMNLQPTNPQGLTCMIKGIAVHELIHVIGFHHQQNAPERDDFVDIIWNNIEDNNNARYQFTKLSYDEASSYGAPYDYGSIMHYARKDFSRNGGDTIVAKRQGARFGQRERISDWDAFKVNKMYKCPT